MSLIARKLNSIHKKLRRRKFIANASAYISSNVLLKSASFLLIPIWTRFLTPADYGIIGTLGAYGGVLMPLLMMGLHGAAVRHYYDYKDNPIRRKGYVTSVMLFQMLFSTFLIIMLNIWGPALWARFTSENIPFDPYVRLMLWYVCVANWIHIPKSLYQAQQKARSYVYIGYGGFLLTVIAKLVLVVGLRQGAYGYMMGQLIATVILTVVVFSFVFSEWFVPEIKWEYIRAGLTFGLPIVPHTMSGWALKASDRLILEHSVPLTELGLYNFGHMVGQVAEFLVGGISQAWSPYYYRLMENHPNPDTKIVQVVSFYIALIGGICLSGILFAGEIIYILLPSSYYGATSYISPILLGFLLLGFYLFAVQPLFYFKKTELLPILTGGVAIFSIILNIWLVPRYGAMASAWITTFAFGLRFLVFFIVSQRYQKIDYPLFRYLAPVSIIIISTFASVQLNVWGFWSLGIKLILLTSYILVAFLLLIKPYMKASLSQYLLEFSR